MVQKVIKIGSSAGITIPKKSLKELGLKIGDRVSVDIDEKRRIVRIKPAVNVDKEILDWTEGFIDKYRPALDALAKK